MSRNQSETFYVSEGHYSLLGDLRMPFVAMQVPEQAETSEEEDPQFPGQVFHVQSFWVSWFTCRLLQDSVGATGVVGLRLQVLLTSQ